MAEKVRDLYGVIAAEAGGKSLRARYRDMQHIASVMVNRARMMGKPVEKIFAIRSEFNAYNKAYPPGTKKLRGLAQHAMESVLTNGPVTNATFYATPKAQSNLPKGLKYEGTSGVHNYFTDPQNRAIRTLDGFVRPNPNYGQVADVPTPTARPDPEMAMASPERFRPMPTGPIGPNLAKALESRGISLPADRPMPTGPVRQTPTGPLAPDRAMPTGPVRPSMPEQALAAYAQRPETLARMQASLAAPASPKGDRLGRPTNNTGVSATPAQIQAYADRMGLTNRPQQSLAPDRPMPSGPVGPALQKALEQKGISLAPDRPMPTGPVQQSPSQLSADAMKSWADKNGLTREAERVQNLRNHPVVVRDGQPPTRLANVPTPTPAPERIQAPVQAPSQAPAQAPVDVADISSKADRVRQGQLSEKGLKDYARQNVDRLQQSVNDMVAQVNAGTFAPTLAYGPTEAPPSFPAYDEQVPGLPPELQPQYMPPAMPMAPPQSFPAQPSAPSLRPGDIYGGQVGTALATGGNTVSRYSPSGPTVVSNKYGAQTAMTPQGYQSAFGQGPDLSKLGDQAKQGIASLAGGALGSMLGGPVGGVVGSLLGREATQKGTVAGRSVGGFFSSLFGGGNQSSGSKSSGSKSSGGGGGSSGRSQRSHERSRSGGL